MSSTRLGTRFFSVLAGGAIGASLILTACGGGSKGNGSGNGLTSSETPQQAVQTAVAKLGAQPEIKLVLTLPISAGQVKQLSSQGGGKPATDAQAHAISTGSVFLNVATGSGEALDSTQAMTDPNDSVDFGLTIGGNTPFEILYSGQNLYARVQLQQLLTDVGENPAKASQFANQLNSLNTFVPGISQLGTGAWVEIDHASLQSLAPLLKQIESSSGSTADPSTLKTDIMRLRTQLLTAVRANSTFKSTGADHYNVTVQVSNLLSTIKPEIQNAVANIPGLGADVTKALTKMQAGIPAGQTAVIELSTSGGKLSQAQMDLNQFAGKDKVNFAVPVRVDFTSPGAAQAPANATKLNVSRLPTLLGGLLGTKSAA